LTDDEINLMNKIMTERRKKHWAVEKNIDWMDGMPLTLDEIKTFYTHTDLQKLLDRLIALKYLKLEKCKELINGKRVYKEDSLEGYNICKGKLSFPISTILDPNGICPTLTATDSSKLVFIIDNKYIRRLTDNELKKICGFPVTFQIPTNVDKFDLFGNMVTPPVIVSILKQILEV
jgi:DNA (cytosine-5)-methyltransferase 1